MKGNQLKYLLILTQCAAAGIARAQETSDNIPSIGLQDVFDNAVDFIVWVLILLAMPGLILPVYRYAKRAINKKSLRDVKDKK